MKTVTATSIALGGEEIPVTFRTGETAAVKVRFLEVDQYNLCLKLADNLAALAELYCGQPEGWAATLHPPSILEIVDLGHDLNFASVCRWAEWQTKLSQAAGPLLSPSPSRTPTPSGK